MGIFWVGTLRVLGYVDGRYPAKRKMTKIQIEDGSDEGASLGEADGVIDRR